MDLGWRGSAETGVGGSSRSLSLSRSYDASGRVEVSGEWVMEEAAGSIGDMRLA